ncbi:MAG: hypothetical protein LBP52_00270 [Burkholderiaceae bacterium]|jgi:hypothetical protein|nr:hypothetical protein [Burkholderiaceae bacterium]
MSVRVAVIDQRVQVGVGHVDKSLVNKFHGDGSPNTRLTGACLMAALHTRQQQGG